MVYFPFCVSKHTLFESQREEKTCSYSMCLMKAYLFLLQDNNKEQSETVNQNLLTVILIVGVGGREEKN